MARSPSAVSSTTSPRSFVARTVTFSRALDLFMDTAKREAPLFPQIFALAGDDLGVDEHPKIAGLVFACGINDEKAQRYTHLRRGEPAARRRVHGFLHVFDEGDHLGGNGRDWLGAVAKPLIGILEDAENRHVEKPCEISNTQGGASQLNVPR